MDRIETPITTEQAAAWSATRAKIVNGPRYDHYQQRDKILSLAARADLYHIGHNTETGESFAVLVAPNGWLVEVSVEPSGKITNFDAWNRKERFIFWYNTVDVKHLLDLIGWVCEECNKAVGGLVYDLDPYQKDVWGEDEMRLLCRPCIQRIGDDI